MTDSARISGQLRELTERLRWERRLVIAFSGTVARLEVPARDIERAAACRTALDAALRSAGCIFGTVDLTGFTSGRLNVLLPLPSVPSTR